MTITIKSAKWLWVSQPSLSPLSQLSLLLQLLHIYCTISTEWSINLNTPPHARHMTFGVRAFAYLHKFGVRRLVLFVYFVVPPRIVHILGNSSHITLSLCMAHFLIVNLFYHRSYVNFRIAKLYFPFPYRIANFGQSQKHSKVQNLSTLDIIKNIRRFSSVQSETKSKSKSYWNSSHSSKS